MSVQTARPLTIAGRILWRGTQVVDWLLEPFNRSSFIFEKYTFWRVSVLQSHPENYLYIAIGAIISSDDWQFLEITVCAHLYFNCNGRNYISWLTILGTQCMPIYILTPILGALAAVRWLIFNLTRQKIWHGMLILRRRAGDPYFAPFWPRLMQHFILQMTCSYAAWGGELHKDKVYINGFITR